LSGVVKERGQRMGGDMSVEELQRYLHSQIPLSRSMALEVMEIGPGRIVLEAPLGPNTNHRSTAFGGSVSTLATLAGWSTVYTRLHAEGRRAHTVIQRSSIEYITPVRTRFRAICEGVDERGWNRLLRALDRRGMGRARVAVRVEAAGVVVARFEGAYVAISSDEDVEGSLGEG